jgi:hypothetical protein
MQVDPVTRDVNDTSQLKERHERRVEVAEAYEESQRGTPVHQLIQHRTKLCSFSVKKEKRKKQEPKNEGKSIVESSTK